MNARPSDDDLRERMEREARFYRPNGHDPGGAAAPSPFRPLLPSQLPEPTIPRLVHRLLAEGAVALLYGDWGSGKSFLAVDMACSIADGIPWRGRATPGGPVIYMAGEAGASIGRRVRAWLWRHGDAKRPDPPIGIVTTAPNLLDATGLDEAMVEARTFVTGFGQPLRLVVVDTLHAAAPGSEENARDCGRILASVRQIIRETDAAVLLVHHSGKDQTRGARGSNSLEASADLVLEVRDDDPRARSVIVRKLRDGEAPELEPFVLDPVTLGYDVDGEAITSAVAVAIEQPPPDPGDPRREEARTRRARGESLRTIARALGVGKSTVERWLS